MLVVRRGSIVDGACVCLFSLHRRDDRQSPRSSPWGHVTAATPHLSVEPVRSAKYQPSDDEPDRLRACSWHNSSGLLVSGCSAQPKPSAATTTNTPASRNGHPSGVRSTVCRGRRKPDNRRRRDRNERRDPAGLANAASLFVRERAVIRDEPQMPLSPTWDRWRVPRLLWLECGRTSFRLTPIVAECGIARTRKGSNRAARVCRRRPSSLPSATEATR